MPDEKKEQVHEFHAGVAWTGDGAGEGVVRIAEGDVKIPIGSSRALDGSGHGANPEELLLSAVGSCFAATWAIFLKKFALSYAEPSLALSGTLEKDPAGGYRMSGIRIRAKVPSSLMDGRRSEIEKTLSLTEKYCIISKVAKAAMPVSITIEEV